jgi:nicotinamide mononucleotide transporter
MLSSTMSSLVLWMNQPLLLLWGYTMSWGEAAGFVTGLWCVWLASRGHILNFPVGIVNSALLLLVFVEARLFADAALQILFITLGVEGWWRWTRAVREAEGPVRHLSPRATAVSLLFVLLLVGALLPVLSWARGSVPVFDSLITALSVVAQVLLNKRRVESWYFWIAVDIVSVPVYAFKGLYLIALLYALFLGLACRGAWRWRAEARAVPA